jgi:hypothetical protein
LRIGAAGHIRVMALRIAVGVVAALRAVLIFGEAADLSTRPIRVPSFRRARRPALAPAPADVRVLS